MTGDVTSLGIGDGGRKIRGIKEPGDSNTVQYLSLRRKEPYRHRK
jgi:hypothetical protein